VWVKSRMFQHPRQAPASISAGTVHFPLTYCRRGSAQICHQTRSNCFVDVYLFSADILRQQVRRIWVVAIIPANRTAAAAIKTFFIFLSILGGPEPGYGNPGDIIPV